VKRCEVFTAVMIQVITLKMEGALSSETSVSNQITTQKTTAV